MFFRQFISLKSWVPNILQRDMCDWKVTIVNIHTLQMEIMLLIDMDLEENNCPELTLQTADAIDDVAIHRLFVSTQMNNLDLCVKSALQ